jgi:tetratricopeptide (TPR) repeat protein
MNAGKSTPVESQCSSPKQCAEMHFMISDLKLRDSDISGAIEQLDEAVKYDPSSPYLYLQLARLYAQKQSYKQAIGYTEKALSIDKTYIPALYTKADILSNTGENKQAIDILKQVVKLSPDSESAYIALALTQYHANDAIGAKSTLEDMIVHIPSSPYPYYYLAKIAVDEKNYKEAIADYNKAFKANPDFYTALYEEADVYAYMKNYDKAVEVYRRILVGNPDEYGLYEKTGDLYLTAKKYTDALNSYKKAEVYIPSLVLQLKIGMVYVELKQYTHAEATFKSIIESNPSFYRAYYYYGLLLAENKKYKKSIEILKKVPSDDDMYTSSVEEIAIIYSQQNNNKEAEKILFPIVKKYPTVEHYNLFASFFEQDKDYKPAIDILNKALNKFTDSQAILYHLGVIYDQSGETENAISVMKQILKINPKNADALNYIGYTYADKGIKLDSAETMIKEALKIKPDDGYITDSLGWVYYKKGLLKKAIVTLKKAVTLSKDDPQILVHLGDAYLRAGEKLSAIKTYKMAIDSKRLTDEKLKKKLQGKLLKLGAK